MYNIIYTKSNKENGKHIFLHILIYTKKEKKKTAIAIEFVFKFP